jgi:hypothetical protein
MTDTELLRVAACTALWLSCLTAGCGSDAVKLGSDPPPSQLTYERFALASELSARIAEPAHVQPSVVYRPTVVDVNRPGGYIARLPDQRLALVRIVSGNPYGGTFRVELLDEEASLLAAAEAAYSVAPAHLDYYPRIFAGYGGGLWVMLGLDFGYTLVHFDDQLNVVSTASAAGPSALPLISEFLAGVGELDIAHPIYGLHAAPFDSACAQLNESAGGRIRGRAWVDRTLWLAGCSNPPADLPNALSKPAIYQCTEGGELVQAGALELLSPANLCFTAASRQQERIVGLIDADVPTIAWVDPRQRIFDLLRIHKDPPSLGEAMRSIPEGSVVLDASRLVARALAPGANGEVLFSASDTSRSANILCLALPPPAGSARCVRLNGTVDDIFSSIVLTEARRAFVWHDSGELWGVDLAEAAP